MSERKQVRLSDIAERLGLSKMSVSKALRNQPDISEETRARVKNMAEEMGYVPNLVARSLSAKQSKTIGVVLPKIAHYFFSSALEGIQEQAAEHGYEIVLTVSQEKAGLERQHLETLLAMRVDGLLVSVSQESPDRSIYERVREMGVPLVFFDRPLEGLDFSSVTVDDQAGAQRAIEAFIERGYEKIAHVAGYSHVSIGRARRAGYEAALRKHDISLGEDWVVEGGFDERSGYQGFKHMLSNGKLPEAVFAVTFPVGLGVLDALREVQPERLGQMPIMVFGNRALNRYLEHPFTCIDQPARVLGERAAGLVVEEMHDRRAGPKQIILSTRLISPKSGRGSQSAEGPSHLEDGRRTFASERAGDQRAGV